MGSSASEGLGVSEPEVGDVVVVEINGGVSFCVPSYVGEPEVAGTNNVVGTEDKGVGRFVVAGMI